MNDFVKAVMTVLSFPVFLVLAVVINRAFGGGSAGLFADIMFLGIVCWLGDEVARMGTR